MFQFDNWVGFLRHAGVSEAEISALDAEPLPGTEEYFDWQILVERLWCVVTDGSDGFGFRH